MTRIESWCEGIIEAAWLAALAVAPLFVNFYSETSFDPDKAAAVRILAMVMIGAWVVKVASGGRLVCPPAVARDSASGSTSGWRCQVLAPALLFAGCLAASSALSLDPNLSWGGSYLRGQGAWTGLAYLSFFAAVLSHLRRPDQLRRLIFVTVLAGLAAALYGVGQHLGLDPIPWASRHDRSGGTLGNPIFLGGFLLMSSFVTLAALIERFAARPTRGKWEVRLPAILRAGVLLYALLLQVAALAISQSRGPVLGLLAGSGVFVLGVVARRRWRIRWRLIGLAAPLLVGLILLLTAAPFAGRLAGLADPTTGTARVRLSIWQGTLEMLSSGTPLESGTGEVDRRSVLRPWIGHGPETFALAFPRFHPPELSRLEKPGSAPDRAHNAILDVLVTLGACGLVAWLWLWGGLCRLGWVDLRRATGPLIPALLATLAAHFFELQFSFAVTATEVYFWVLAAVLVAVSQGWVRPATARPAAAGRPGGLREGWRAGWPAAPVFGCLGFLFVAAWQGTSGGWTAGAGTGGGAGILWLLLPAALGAAAMAPGLRPAGWAAFGVAGLGPAAVLAAVHAGWLFGLADSPEDLLGRSDQVSRLVSVFVWWLVAAVFAAGFALARPAGRQWARRPGLTAPVAVVILLAGGWWIDRSQVAPLRAGVMLKHAATLLDTGRVDRALDLLAPAARLWPGEPRVFLTSGRAALAAARAAAGEEERDAYLERGLADLERARELAPFDPDHTVNLARFLVARGDLTPDAGRRSEVHRRAAGEYRRALGLKPRSETLPVESALLAERLGPTGDLR